jgi:hypothetical protein
MPPKDGRGCIGMGRSPNCLRGRRVGGKTAFKQVFMGPVSSLLKNRQPKHRLKLLRLSGASVVNEILLL